jgi:all-trans-retinol 13,14-reductase
METIVSARTFITSFSAVRARPLIGSLITAKLIPKQVGLTRMGYRTELPNLFLIGASAGYPSVPGVIENGMDVAELMTGQTVWHRSQVAEAVMV